MPVILATDLIVYFLFLMFASSVWLSARKEGYMKEVWAHIKKDRLAVVCLSLLCLYGVVALIDSIRWRDTLPVEKSSARGNIFSPQPLSILDRIMAGRREHSEKTFSAPFATHLYVKETMEMPDGKTVRDYPPLQYPRSHWLGTDKVGSDVLFSALKGIRTGVVIGTGTTIIIIPFAIFFGVLAGYFGGFIDDVIQYIYTTLSSIPGVLLIVAFMLLFGQSGYQGGLIQKNEFFLKILVPNDRLFWLCLILGITSWTGLCRVIRGETLKLRELEYVQASRALGVPGPGVIYRHV